MLGCLVSGGSPRGADAIILAVVSQMVLEAAAEDQQASVLAGVERVRLGHARPPAELIRLVVVAGALAVKRSTESTHVLLLLGHVRQRSF